MSLDSPDSHRLVLLILKMEMISQNRTLIWVYK